MAILKIARMGHPVLVQRAERVAQAGSPEIGRLIADLGETMRDAGGIGLAAPQVHVPLRVFVWLEGEAVRALVNPALSPIEDGPEAGWEGCLSIPGLRGLVPRFRRVAWSGEGADGEALSGEAEGLLARVMQHEFDHLEGILYPMRMPDLSRFGFTEELARHGEGGR